MSGAEKEEDILKDLSDLVTGSFDVIMVCALTYVGTEEEEK